MKIKSDFVTNSSSTCYVVFVPNRFVPSDEEIKEAIDEEKTYWSDDEYQPLLDDFETTKEEVMECIESLKEGGNIYRTDYGDGVDHRIYSVVQMIVSSNGFDITSVEMTSDGGDTILGVPEEKVIEIFTSNFDITGLATLIQGERNVSIEKRLHSD
jgi:hypothetical protein